MSGPGPHARLLSPHPGVYTHCDRAGCAHVTPRVPLGFRTGVGTATGHDVAETPVSPAPVFSARRPSQPLTLKEESHPPWGQRAWELAVNAPPAHPHGDDVGDIVPTLSLVILSVSSQTAHTLCSGRPRRSLTDCPQEALRPTSGSDRDGPGPCCWDTAGPILEAARSINGGRLRQSRKDCFTRMAATRTQPGERQETRKGLEH